MRHEVGIQGETAPHGVGSETRASVWTLSIVIPCYDEAHTLEACVRRVLAIADDSLKLEILIVDDGSRDDSAAIGERLAQAHPAVKLIRQPSNQGKGVALRRGFAAATGDFVAVQDADLEYDPQDLKRLVQPLIEGIADVVFGSRFLAGNSRRVLYFWHSVANQFLTLLSNIFTDLNVTDMETCYKVFRRDVLQRLKLRENRFGIEPELVARVAQQRVRVYEMGVSYRGRTYEEGKKIGWKDALRALYCVVRYNASCAPWPVQFAFYLVIGGCASVVNLLVFWLLLHAGVLLPRATVSAFAVAAAFNYFLCILLLFRHRARWNSVAEVLIFAGTVAVIGFFDRQITLELADRGWTPLVAKLVATATGVVLNFVGRRWLVFPEPGNGPWQRQGRIESSGSAT
ncbi:MAG: bifunctional glycosyltransferase family 2/GtrA family protein [Verrucomicrobia bacterium]|nr:bifunctional glycosyltransferase family 2/GtrA family protein [Verrucomicrobiota bacterium]